MNGENSGKSWDDILNEIRMGEDRVGFINNFAKVAAIVPRQDVKKKNRIKYDNLIKDFQERAYTLFLIPNINSENMTKRDYSVFEKLEPPFSGANLVW